MSIKITVANKVGIKVKGSLNNEAGAPQPFDFSLTCHRLDADQLTLRLKEESEQSLIDFMLGVVEDWAGVRDADDKPMPYSEANYRALCKIPGVAGLAFRTYLRDVGAQEKN